MKYWIQEHIKNFILFSINSIPSDNTDPFEQKEQNKAILILSVLLIFSSLSWLIICFGMLNLKLNYFSSLLIILTSLISLAMLRKQNQQIAWKSLVLGIITSIMIESLYFKNGLIALNLIQILPNIIQFIPKSKQFHQSIFLISSILNILSNYIFIRNFYHYPSIIDKEHEILASSLLSFILLILQNLLSNLTYQNFEELLDNLMQSQETLNKNKKILEVALTSKNTIIAGLSHEFRNPLNSILGSIDLLLNTVRAPNILSILKDAKICGEVLLNILSNILDAGKLDSNNLEISSVTIDLKSIIEKVIIIEKQNLIKKRIIFHVLMDKTLPKMVSIDSNRLLQILVNLMSNATKFTGESGKVVLIVSVVRNKIDLLKSPEIPNINCMLNFPFSSLTRRSNQFIKDLSRETIPINITSVNSLARIDSEQELLSSKQKNVELISSKSQINRDNCIYNITHLHPDNYDQEVSLNHISLPTRSSIDIDTDIDIEKEEYLQFEIQDNGCSIPSENLSSIFEMFYQGDSSIARNHGGLGLGLWICKKLCQKMKGDITVFSELGQGSSFIFYLPLKRARKRSRIDSNSTNKDSHFLKALLVDDLDFNNNLHKKMLSKFGVHCNVQSSGKEALKIFTSRPEGYFDFIFMDLQMPEMDGKTVCRLIREFERNNERKGVDIYIVSGKTKIRLANKI